MTQTAVRNQTTVAQEPKTKCLTCRWREADMAEHCDLHTQRRMELDHGRRQIVLGCTGYERDIEANQ